MPKHAITFDQATFEVEVGFNENQSEIDLLDESLDLKMIALLRMLLRFGREL